MRLMSVFQPFQTLELRRHIARQCLELGAIRLLYRDRDMSRGTRLAISNDARLAGVRATHDDAMIAIYNIGRRIRPAFHCYPRFLAHEVHRSRVSAFRPLCTFGEPAEIL